MKRVPIYSMYLYSILTYQFTSSYINNLQKKVARVYALNMEYRKENHPRPPNEAKEAIIYGVV